MYFQFSILAPGETQMLPSEDRCRMEILPCESLQAGHRVPLTMCDPHHCLRDTLGVPRHYSVFFLNGFVWSMAILNKTWAVENILRSGF